MTPNDPLLNTPPGFVDPVLDSQRTFRFILDAMARPGKVNQLGSLPSPPAPLLPAAAAVCLTLLDLDTPLWLDAKAAAPQVTDYLRFETGCPLAGEPGKAAFALVADPAQMPPLSSFAQGSAEYPDRSATLIIQVASLGNQAGRTLRGPGIKDSVQLEAGGLPDSVWEQLRDNHEIFPLGVDLILTTQNEVACLPRTVQVEA
jgi:alpha-D-ribose 1-methylphosphonate 5-triphosphate synthase subunit PhnH